jgi:CBS domain-containing protein
MREHDIGAIPIGENDRLIGMVTDRDIVCKGLAEDGFDAGGATARDALGVLHGRRTHHRTTTRASWTRSNYRQKRPSSKTYCSLAFGQ